MSTKSSIAIINQYFFPGESAAGVLLRELAEDLSADFEVTVVCEPEDNADGECAALGDYRVVRLAPPRWLSRATKATSLVLRWLGAGLFLARSALWLFFLKRETLVVLASEPPFVDSVLGLLCWATNRPYALLIQDLYPEMAEAVRLKPICFAAKPLKWLHSQVAHRARAVIAISPDQKRSLQSRNAKVTHILPNWAPTSSTEGLEPLAGPADLPPERTRLILHYVGNLGLACDLGTLSDAVELLHGSGQLEGFSIVIRGDGLKARQAQALADRYPQVQLREKVPQSQVRPSIELCHAHLVLMPAELLGCVCPSKANSIMAYGRPMIACVPAGSHIEKFVAERQLGYVSRAGDPHSLAAAMLDCLSDLRSSPQKLRDMGLNGWRYARHEWTRRHAAARYRDVLMEAVGHG